MRVQGGLFRISLGKGKKKGQVWKKLLEGAVSLSEISQVLLKGGNLPFETLGPGEWSQSLTTGATKALNVATNATKAETGWAKQDGSMRTCCADISPT